MMFQRADPDPSDPNLGSFYGLAMPLLKRGIPVEPVQIESANSPGFPRPVPPPVTYLRRPEASYACFPRRAGAMGSRRRALWCVDDDSDPYDKVREWWNTAPLILRHSASAPL